MQHDQLRDILDAQLQRVRDVLVAKNDDYSPDEDALEHFRRAATILGKTVPEALAGMMVKHTVSIYTMIEGGRSFSEDRWDEKITDHINYLVLLKAALVDAEQTPSEE